MESKDFDWIAGNIIDRTISSCKKANYVSNIY